MTTAAIRKSGHNWRVADNVVAALIAVAGGVIFWAWSQGANLISTPVNAVYPPLSGLYAVGWMIPAVLGMLIVRNPGAALICEAVAANGELIMGSQYGTTVLISGILQDMGAELVFAAFMYKKFNLPVSLVADAGAGVFCGLNDSFAPWTETSHIRAGTSSRTSCSAPSPAAIIAGALSWITTRGLAKTGVLSSLASRKAAREPLFN